MRLESATAEISRFTYMVNTTRGHNKDYLIMGLMHPDGSERIFSAWGVIGKNSLGQRELADSRHASNLFNKKIEGGYSPALNLEDFIKASNQQVVHRAITLRTDTISSLFLESVGIPPPPATVSEALEFSPVEKTKFQKFLEFSTVAEDEPTVAHLVYKMKHASSLQEKIELFRKNLYWVNYLMDDSVVGQYFLLRSEIKENPENRLQKYLSSIDKDLLTKKKIPKGHVEFLRSLWERKDLSFGEFTTLLPIMGLIKEGVAPLFSQKAASKKEIENVEGSGGKNLI